MAVELPNFWKWPSEDGSADLFESLFLDIMVHALELIWQCGQ